MCWKFRKEFSLQRIIKLVLGLCLEHLEFFKLLLTSNTSHTVAIQNDHFLTDNYQYYITLLFKVGSKLVETTTNGFYL